ncbi:MAG: hypothetical protein EXR85_00115 [Xanthomonadales bacterium]|nr:hypothetical protein [Xanthomonadales bacterium]
MLKLPPAGLQSIGAIAATETMPMDLGTSSRRRQALNWLPAQWPHPRLIAYAALVIAPLLLFAELHQKPFDVNIIRFLVADATGIALALMIGLVGLAYYQSFKTRSLLFISIGFIGSGITDLVHLVQTLNTNQHMFPVLFFQVKEWSTLAAHLFLAILLLVGWRTAEDHISPRATSELGTKGIHWFVIALILLTFSKALLTPLAVHAGGSVDLTAHGLRLAGYAMAFVARLSSTPNLLHQASSIQLEDRINSLIREYGRTHSPGFVSTVQDQRITGSGTFELDLETGRE